MNKEDYYKLLGKVFRADKKFDKAEGAYTKAIEIKKNFFGAYLALGDLYAAQGQVNEAIKSYNDAVKVNPDIVDPYMQLGSIYEKKGEIDKAKKYYQKVLKINPEFALAANNLAWIYSEHGGDIEEALSLARIAKEKLPDDPGIADTLGWIYYKKGLFHTALPFLEESVGKIENNPIIHYHLGMAYSKSGEKEKAKEHLSASLAINSEYKGAVEAQKTLEVLIQDESSSEE